eukprot:scaffold122877_cov28-Tisochrysis_lutea.AAC.3
MNCDLANVRNLEVGVQRRGELKRLGTRVDHGERGGNGVGSIKADRILQFEGRREDLARLVIIGELEHHTGEGIYGCTHYFPLGRVARETVFWVVSTGSELRPADWHTTADRLAPAVLCGGADVELLLACADPGCKMGRVDVDQCGRARRVRQLDCGQAIGLR